MENVGLCHPGHSAREKALRGLEGCRERAVTLRAPVSPKSVLGAQTIEGYSIHK